MKRRDDRWPVADEIIRWNDEGEHRCRLQTSDKRWYAEDMQRRKYERRKEAVMTTEEMMTRW